MKISNNKELLKPVELVNTDDGGTSLKLQGDATITVEHKTTDEVSTVAVVRESGEMDFIARPSVGGVDVALATDGDSSLDSEERTIVDNASSVIALCPVQEMVSVLYALRNDSVREHGTITISKSSTGFTVVTDRNAEDGYYGDIEFSASENNGSLLLNVVGSGAGLITDFKYRVNAVNTLYL